MEEASWHFTPPWNRWVEPCEQETRKSYIQHMGVEPKIGGKPPKIDGL